MRLLIERCVLQTRYIIQDLWTICKILFIWVIWYRVWPIHSRSFEVGDIVKIKPQVLCQSIVNIEDVHICPKMSELHGVVTSVYNGTNGKLYTIAITNVDILNDDPHYKSVKNAILSHMPNSIEISVNLLNYL